MAIRSGGGAAGQERGDLLVPDFKNAYWRSEEQLPYKRHASFSAQKKHFVPEEHGSHAERFAKELASGPVAEEIHRIYENAVALLGLKRSKMEKGEASLETALFRFEVRVSQAADPSLVLYSRRTEVLAPLNKLPEHFDEVFPWKASEVVVPFGGAPGKRELLEALEHWEERLKGKLEENVQGDSFCLRLRSGFTMKVEQASRELVFARAGTEGVAALSAALAADLRALGLKKSLL